MGYSDEFLDKLSNGGWSLLDESPMPIGEDIIQREALPYINDPKSWEQFNNPVIYDLDVRIRKWIDEMKHIPDWYKRRTSRYYTASMLIKILLNRDYDPKIDMKYMYVYKQLFAYYSSQVKANYFDVKSQKTKSKTCYVISTKGTSRPPYSLKLRLEWLQAQGELPNQNNMKLPKDDLKPGHARNPKTEENIERRREAVRKRYYNEQHSKNNE